MRTKVLFTLIVSLFLSIVLQEVLIAGKMPYITNNPSAQAARRLDVPESRGVYWGDKMIPKAARAFNTTCAEKRISNIQNELRNLNTYPLSLTTSAHTPQSIKAEKLVREVVQLNRYTTKSVENRLKETGDEIGMKVDYYDKACDAKRAKLDAKFTRAIAQIESLKTQTVQLRLDKKAMVKFAERGCPQYANYKGDPSLNGWKQASPELRSTYYDLQLKLFKTQKSHLGNIQPTQGERHKAITEANDRIRKNLLKNSARRHLKGYSAEEDAYREISVANQGHGDYRGSYPTPPALTIITAWRNKGLYYNSETQLFDFRAK